MRRPNASWDAMSEPARTGGAEHAGVSWRDAKFMRVRCRPIWMCAANKENRSER